MSEGHDDHGHGKKSFISTYLFSFDHKMIGKQYLTLAMMMALVGGTLAMLVRLQLGWPGTQWPLVDKFFPVGMASGV
jgi:cytochrome c oxidase subunit 1